MCLLISERYHKNLAQGSDNAIKRIRVLTDMDHGIMKNNTLILLNCKEVPIPPEPTTHIPPTTCHTPPPRSIPH
ncbi:hypothetical protein JTE90_021904 [Oedothorax gibbosus]|uniref:Uncharacterized protein n=1 Tax=Oedothorax gibbosus TaxID=931172 RepID=A0AAV6VU68_9ARAC|nr:hypothetical protein JTE90_021904 [Oedothorax gibbosus]